MTLTRGVILALVAFSLGVVITGAVTWHTIAPANAQRPIVWTMQSSWPAANLLHYSPLQLAKMIEQMSGGRLKWDIQPAGTIVPAFEVLDAVNKGLLDAAHTWPGYWAGKNSAAGLFAPPPGGPFGLGRDEYLSWLLVGGGLELYNEMLQKELKYNVVAFYTSGLPYWEALGWFRKTFTTMDDLKRLRFRTSGLGLEMMRTMGVAVVSLAGGEVIPALERGVIDGAEWAIPSHDILMGFHNVTKNYYMPDFRQPPSFQEILVNKKVWDALPSDLQAIVRYACWAEIIRMSTYSINLDSKAAEELTTKHGVQIRRTPDEVLRAQLEAIDKVYDAESRRNPFFARVLASQREFARRVVPHAQRVRPPLELVVAHYWQRKNSP
jgi:TRAP-type mannitol/chloroaromatic compound transport system substrate-binding protein